MQQRRLSFQFTDYEWIIMAEAIDQYAYKHSGYLDTAFLDDAVDYIQKEVKIQ